MVMATVVVTAVAKEMVLEMVTVEDIVILVIIAAGVNHPQEVEEMVMATVKEGISN